MATTVDRCSVGEKSVTRGGREPQPTDDKITRRPPPRAWLARRVHNCPDLLALKR